MKSPIYYTKPSITELEVRYATDAAANGWGEKCYEYINRFEQAFANHLGVKYAIATSSCTGALHMGLAALGIGPGDEIILADINWIASVAPIKHLGATPVFVDILPDTWCLDPEKVEAAITPQTKAIIAVHIYGNVCDMARLLEIGEKYKIPVIEDAAEAIGSVWHGKRAGSIGKFGTFSFHGTKTITTGEGGMFVTNDAELYEYVLTLSNHGRSRTQKKQFWPDLVGFKYKMSNIQAAIGLGQIERVEELIAEKRKVFHLYQEGLKTLPLRMNPEPENVTNGFWMPTIVVNEEIPFDRTVLLEKFKENGIDARVFFWPLSRIPLGFETRYENQVANQVSERGINLPSFHGIEPFQQDEVIRIIRDVFERKTE